MRSIHLQTDLRRRLDIIVGAGIRSQDCVTQLRSSPPGSYRIIIMLNLEVTGT